MEITANIYITNTRFQFLNGVLRIRVNLMVQTSVTKEPSFRTIETTLDQPNSLELLCISKLSISIN